MNKRDYPVEELSVPDPKRHIFEFLSKQDLAVLATVDGLQPEAAVVQYSVTPNLELVFDTDKSFRKYRNLQSNQLVALAIGWDHATVQYEGVATELEEPELSIYREIHLKNCPDAALFEQFIGNRYFKIVPRWIRYTDVSNFPRKLLDVSFG
jgi:uncharacterized pyridoxamine 5'-phosphate oxidase family protein